MAEDFELVSTKRGGLQKVWNELDKESKNEIVKAVCNNFGDVVKLAEQVVEIKKMYAESDIRIAELEEKRATLREETNSYIDKMEAGTRRMVQRSEQVRTLLNDYYKNCGENINPEVVKELIKATEVVD